MIGKDIRGIAATDYDCHTVENIYGITGNNFVLAPPRVTLARKFTWPLDPVASSCKVVSAERLPPAMSVSSENIVVLL